jgi:hypothetical protein
MCQNLKAMCYLEVQHGAGGLEMVNGIFQAWWYTYYFFLAFLNEVDNEERFKTTKTTTRRSSRLSSKIIYVYWLINQKKRLVKKITENIIGLIAINGSW